MIHPTAEIAVVIDGQPHPWYRASWDPDRVDLAAVFADGMTGTPRFDPSDREPSGGPSGVERIILNEVGKRGVSLTALPPTPRGMATELRVTGSNLDVVIPLGDREDAAPNIEWNKDDLTPAEILWVGTLLSRLRQRRGFSLGIFGDFVVATALPGSVLSPGGTDRHDLTWHDIKVEVKTSTKSRWTVSPANGRDAEGTKVKRLWADVYVLCLHEGSDHRAGWSFYVVPRGRLNPDAPTSIGRGKIREWWLRQVEPDALPEAILAASKPGSST